jgi:hypothetical protein
VAGNWYVFQTIPLFNGTQRYFACRSLTAFLAKFDLLMISANQLYEKPVNGITRNLLILRKVHYVKPMSHQVIVTAPFVCVKRSCDRVRWWVTSRPIRARKMRFVLVVVLTPNLIYIFEVIADTDISPGIQPWAKICNRCAVSPTGTYPILISRLRR